VTHQGASNRQRCRFGGFLLDPTARELRRAGDLLTLSPKAFDCITYLIEHRGRAVGRDELIAAVWGRTDVADVQLGYLMRKVRRTLGDSGEGQSFIRTIPRFGFRWVVHTDDNLLSDAFVPTPPVEASPSSTALGRAKGIIEKHLPKARWRTAAWASIVAVTLALTAAVYDWRGHDFATELANTNHFVTSDARAPSSVLAVLPVTGDVGGDSDWMRFGLMDTIAGRLRIAGLIVAPSEDIVVLTRNQTSHDDLVDRTRSAIGAHEVIAPTALRAEHGWTVRLELHSADGRRRLAEAQAPDAILASREAADRLLGLLGVAPSNRPTVPLSTAELLQRIEAALFVADYARARQLIEMAPVALRELPEVQLQWGRVEVAIGRPELARPRFSKLLDTVSADDDAVLRARVLIGLGVADLDHPAAALPRFSEAIALLENLDEPVYLGNAYNDRGIAYKNVGRYEDARIDYARARMAYALANDTLGLAHIDNNEAAVDIERGHPGDALPLLARAAQQFERIGSLDLLVNPLINEISANLALLQYADALTVFQRAQSKFDRLESSSDLHIWKIHGAAALVANGRLREASAVLDDVVRAVTPEREVEVLVLAHEVRAELEYAAGRFDIAMNSAQRALDGISEPNRFPDERAKSWLTLIRALRHLHRDADANAELKRFGAWAREANERAATHYARLAEAEQAANEGHNDIADERYEELLRSVQDGGTPAEAAEIAVSFGNSLIDAGDLVRAGTVAGQIGRWIDSDFSCALLRLRFYHALGKRDAWRTTLDKVQALAGERAIPPALALPPESTVATLQR
jgi:DNA-binding winged helix-turn-helix (wHTH) protein/tetratricopeptide (TPR) repeat protein